MDGIHVGNFGGADDVRDIQITFAAPRRTNTDGLIGEANVKRIPVRLRIDGHRSDSELLASAQNPQGNFTAISDQNFSKHWVRIEAPFEHPVTAWKAIRSLRSGQNCTRIRIKRPVNLLLSVRADTEERLAIFDRAAVLH